MDTVHNPDRFMSDLRQILSQGRKRIGLLVGAGAPIAVRLNAEGKLDASGSPLIPGVEALTSKVLDSLIGNEKVAGAAISAEFEGGGNVEMILSRVRLLQNAIGKTTIHGLDSEGYAQLGKSICSEIGKIVCAKLPQDRCAYNELVSWVSGTQRPHGIEIFTTNYDLLLARIPQVT